MEQRAVIKFHAKIGKSASETFVMMKQAYGDACLSRSNVFLWHKRFVEGRESLEDDEREGRPVSARTPEIIERVRDFIKNDPNASLNAMEEAININRETIRLILRNDLGKTKVTKKSTIHNLSVSKKSVKVRHNKKIQATKNFTK